MIRRIAPQFFTTDIPGTLAYYQDKLGFACRGTTGRIPFGRRCRCVLCRVRRQGCGDCAGTWRHAMGGGASLWSRIATGDCWPSARTCNAFPRLGLQKLAGQPSAVQCIAGPAPQDSAFAPPSGWTASLMRLQAKLARLLLQGLKPEFYLRPYGTT